ncbi:MAG: alpha/beta hydrolase [Ottowia sp.]|uniref:alpha/beta hydrolase n=1 Tax=Ottowia sp. TaxID=1898956 RepID=UPI003C764473
MASPEYAQFLKFLGSPRPDVNPPIEQRRAMVDKWAEMLPPAPGMRFEEAAFAGVPALWNRTPRSRPDHLILYLHGGGFSMGSALNYRDMVTRLALAAEATALSVDYRLAPEHPFPAGLNDVAAVYRELLRQGWSPRQIVFAGDSAGAGLVASALLKLRDDKIELPAAGMCISPFVDLTLSGASMTVNAPFDPIVQKTSATGSVTRYAQTVPPDHPLVSPIFADHTGLPPLLVLAGKKESLMDDAVRLADKARAAGVEVTLELWEDMIHIWPYFAAMIPEGQQALERMGHFAKAHFSP